MTLPDGWERRKMSSNDIDEITSGTVSVWYAHAVDGIAAEDDDQDGAVIIPSSVALAILDDNNLNETANELREKLERAEKMFDITARMLATSWTREFGGDCGENLSNIKRKVQCEAP